MSAKRPRVTIASVDLVVQPSADDVAGFAAPRRGELVEEQSARPAERGDGVRRFEVVVDGWRFEAAVEPADRAELRERARHAAAEHHIAAEITLRAQIPGRVVRLWVAEGEQVEQGQRLLAIEAMKMENEIRAPQAGTVRGVRVDVGSKVEREDELLTVG
jgi:glutaconyl-CoA/methylmalonyl-CoA decarboxylase subunit gamma